MTWSLNFNSSCLDMTLDNALYTRQSHCTQWPTTSAPHSLNVPDSMTSLTYIIIILYVIIYMMSLMASVFWILAVWLLNVLIGVININTTGQLIAYYHWLSLIPAILLAFIPRTPYYPAGELNRSLTRLIGNTVKHLGPLSISLTTMGC